MVDVGSIEFSIVPNLSDLTAGLGDAKSKIDEFADSASTSASKATEGFGGLDDILGKITDISPGGLLEVAGAAVGLGAVGMALNSCADAAGGFQKEITMAGNATGSEAGLADAATKAIQGTAYSSTEAATAINAMAQSGLKNNAIITNLNGVLTLATAANQDVTAASAAYSEELLQFGDSVGSATDAANMLAAAQQHGHASMQDLEQELRRVGPTASALNVSFGTATTALTIMGAKFPIARQAASAFTDILKSFDEPSKTVAASLASIGLSASDVDPKLHTLDEIITTLKDHGVTSADAMTIFGKKLGPELAALLDESNGSFDTMKTNITGTNAATQDAARVNEDYDTKVKALWSSVDTLAVSLGSTLLPAFTEIINVIQGGVTFVSKIGEAFDILGKSAVSGVHSVNDEVKKAFGVDVLGALNSNAETAGDESGTTFSDTTKSTITTADPVAGGLEAGKHAVVAASTSLGQSAGEAFADANKTYIKNHANEMQSGFWDYYSRNKETGAYTYTGIKDSNAPNSSAYTPGSHSKTTYEDVAQVFDIKAAGSYGSTVNLFDKATGKLTMTVQDLDKAIDQGVIDPLIKTATDNAMKTVGASNYSYSKMLQSDDAWYAGISNSKNVWNTGVAKSADYNLLSTNIAGNSWISDVTSASVDSKTSTISGATQAVNIWGIGTSQNNAMMAGNFSNINTLNMNTAANVNQTTISAAASAGTNVQKSSAALYTNVTKAGTDFGSSLGSATKNTVNSWFQAAMNCDVIQRNSAKDSGLTTTSASTAAGKNIENSATSFSTTSEKAGTNFLSNINLAGSNLNTFINSAMRGFGASEAAGRAAFSGGSGGNTTVNGSMNAGGDYADITCTGTVYVNPLHYTGIYGSGNYNPMTFQENGPGMSGGYATPDWMTGGWLSGGFAEGGISDRPMIAKVSEGGRREIHLTESNIKEFGLNAGGNIQVHVYLDKDELAGSLMTRSIQILRTQGGLNYR